MLYGASSSAAREDGPSQPVEASPSVEKDIPPVEKEMTSAEKADTSRSDTGRNNWCTIRKLCFKGIVAPFLHSAVVHVLYVGDVELCCSSVMLRVCLQMRCGVSELVALPLRLRRRAHLVCIACMRACVRVCRVHDTEY